MPQYTGENNWQSITEWIKHLLSDGIDAEDVIEAGDVAIDALVAFDIPGLPNFLEVFIDRFTKQFLQAQLRTLVDEWMASNRPA